MGRPQRKKSDANTLHEALSAALYELLGALQEQGHKLSGFGCREHRSTPSAAGLTKEQKNEIRKQRKAEREQHEWEMWAELDKLRARSGETHLLHEECEKQGIQF